MLGGGIIGEGADGCVFADPMWPCKTGSKNVPSSKDTRFVSKMVKKTDSEADVLKFAMQILGPELNKYIVGIYGECEPADKQHSPDIRNVNSYVASEKAVSKWTSNKYPCGDLKQMVYNGMNVSKDHKLMFITKYEKNLDSWLENISLGYMATLRVIEKAVPQLLVVLQALFQSNVKIINMDLHTGNIIVNSSPFYLGIADFGHCAIKHPHVDPAVGFYGEYLIGYVAKYPNFYFKYRQVPLESRLLNYCYAKKMDNVSPIELLKGWVNDEDVVTSSRNSADLICLHRKSIIEPLLKRILFIRMIEQLQSISRKLRVNPADHLKLYTSLNANERHVIDYILSRYMIFSPFNSFMEILTEKFPTEPMLDKYGRGTSSLVRFILKVIQAPYIQEGSSLVTALRAIEGADMRLVWADC
jgi:hypothetical protein